jgi:hypothetical protein
VLFGCASAATLALVPIQAAGAIEAQTAVVAAADASDTCISPPMISLWYDSDQFGSYAKVSFSQEAVCSPAYPRILSAQVYCADPGPELVYSEEYDTPAGATYFSTRPLPDSCNSFNAIAFATTAGINGMQDKSDSWRWDKGGYPA